jgi:hypothetical protein
MIYKKGKLLGLLVLTLVLLFGVAARALEVQGLYEIELVANSQSAADREIALKQALYAVLSGYWWRMTYPNCRRFSKP